MTPESKAKTTNPERSAPGDKTMPSGTQEWVLTVDQTTGLVTKIERLEMGRREELSATEYAAVAATCPGMLSPTGEATSSAVDQTANLYASYYNPYGQQVYYQGMYDCAAYIAKILNNGTHEEQAYVKGMLDSLSSNA